MIFFLIFFICAAAQAQIFIPTGFWSNKILNVIISDAPAYAYPTVNAGVTQDRTFTLTNFSFYTISNLAGASFTTSNFTFKGGNFPGTGGNCTASLVAGASCNVVVTAGSIMGGTYSDDLVLNYNGYVPQSSTVTLSLTSNANTSPTITTIASRNIYEANYPYIPFQIFDLESTLLCSGANLAASSSDNSVVPPANITYTGVAPYCYLNIIPVAGSTGTANITITVHDLGFPNITASTTFTVTAIPLVSMTVTPKSSIVPKNSNYQYTAIATYSDLSTLDISQSASWTVPVSASYVINSFNGGLLNLGNVTPIAANVNITATYLALSGSVSATFNGSTITSIFVSPTSASINVSGTVGVKCFGRTADGGTIDLTTSCNWFSPNINRAQVNNFSPKGEVLGVSLGGPTIVSATYSSFAASSSITVVSGTPATVEVGTGLLARYFGGMGFNSFINQRIDANIAFAWGAANNPVGGVDAFSVLWTGQILAPETGNYVFHTMSDDGIYLWVNGVLVEDLWTDHGPTEVATGNIAMTAGVKYNIQMAFYENGGGSEVHLKWKVPSSACANYTACPYVPQANLFPTAGVGFPFSVGGVGDSNPGNTNSVNDGITRYYHMNGAGNIASGATITATTGVNSTASNNNGTGLSYVTGVIGQAMSFDGVDDYLLSAVTNLVTGANDRSVSLWINPNNVGAEQGLFFHGTNTNGTGFGASLLASGSVRVIGGGTTTCDSTAVAKYGQWNHVAIRYDDNTTDVVYVTVNGVTTSCNRSLNTATGGNFLLGRSLTVAQRFSGSIDEFAYWNVLFSGVDNTANFLPTMIYMLQQPKPDYTP